MTYKEKLEKLQEYYHREGAIPTYEVMSTIFKATSKTTPYKFVQKALKEGHLKKLPVTRLAPTDKFFL